MIALSELIPLCSSLRDKRDGVQPIPILHSWAYGCHLCQFGICHAPEIHTTQPLYIQRAVQAGMGDITFCDCQAGTTYRRYLQGVWNRLQGPAFDRLKERIRSETMAQPVLNRTQGVPRP